ncbi:TolB family protein [Sphingomonas sp. Root241]|uniref:TolB family protein n=1 Tax=Sphingomonas sp. Root241 TaxID=1736501 RepID=UPI000AD75051|nr:PD40 domain-containing protein [Sphingomonas sp. Root241]
MISVRHALRAAACLILLGGASAGGRAARVAITGAAEPFAPGVASTRYSEIRLTLSPDGRTALWFSRDRLGGPGGYDIWVSRRSGGQWRPAVPVSFNSAGRDFDPAFSADGRFVYFCSDRAGGSGGDDIYRVPVTGQGFGAPVNLGPEVNSAGKEFAPMLSPDGATLLFSSDRSGGAGGHDLFTAHRAGDGFAAAKRLVGALNTAANEFDATFLRDGATIVFARAMDFRRDRVDLLFAVPSIQGYDVGTMLPAAVNNDHDTYGPMLDWSDRSRLIFSGQRGEGGMDLYRVRYRILHSGG